MRTAVMMAIAVVLVATSSAAAEQPGPFGGLRVPPRDAAGRRNPYGRLFRETVQPVPGVALPAIAPKAPATPTVRCGTTLIPGDPRVDPGIVVPRPPATQRFHARIVEPTICR